MRIVPYPLHPLAAAVPEPHDLAWNHKAADLESFVVGSRERARDDFPLVNVRVPQQCARGPLRSAASQSPIAGRIVVDMAERLRRTCCLDRCFDDETVGFEASAGDTSRPSDRRFPKDAENSRAHRLQEFVVELD